MTDRCSSLRGAARRILVVIGAAGAVAGCTADFKGPAPPMRSLDEPVAVAALPDMCHVLVANGNFDLSHRSGSVVPVDVASRSVIADRGVEIGAFAGQIRVHPNGRYGYVSVRGDDSITWFEIVTDGDAPSLDCDADADGRCSDAHRLTVDKEPGSDRLLTEPLGLELACPRDGTGCLPGSRVSGLVTTWMRSGEVAYHPVGADGKPWGAGYVPKTGHRLTTPGFPQDITTVSGAKGLALAAGAGCGAVGGRVGR